MVAGSKAVWRLRGRPRSRDLRPLSPPGSVMTSSASRPRSQYSLQFPQHYPACHESGRPLSALLPACSSFSCARPSSIPASYLSTYSRPVWLPAPCRGSAIPIMEIPWYISPSVDGMRFSPPDYLSILPIFLAVEKTIWKPVILLRQIWKRAGKGCALDVPWLYSLRRRISQ